MEISVSYYESKQGEYKFTMYYQHARCLYIHQVLPIWQGGYKSIYVNITRQYCTSYDVDNIFKVNS